MIANVWVATVEPSRVRNRATDEHDAIGWYPRARPDTWPGPQHPLFPEFVNHYFYAITATPLPAAIRAAPAMTGA